MGWIKYKLLCWLLGDLCVRSRCDSCRMMNFSYGDHYCPCNENDIYIQARKVWGIK